LIYTYLGLVDEVRVYGGARSASQVAADAATTAVNDPSTAAASWSFTGEGGTNYNVYRSASAGGPWTSVASCLSGGAYSDTGLTVTQQYFYKVQIEDASAAGSGPCGGTEFTNTVAVAATPTDGDTPGFSGYQATTTPNCSTGAIDLSWVGATDCSLG